MNSKIVISTLLRSGIINKKKKIGLTAYELSEKVDIQNRKKWTFKILATNIEVG